jgi:hypothetical protein
MKPIKGLIAGDVVAIAAMTVIGFVSHGEGNVSFVPRMGITFFPVLIGWFLLAPWFGLFDPPITSNARSLWRIPLAMLFAAPLASLLRAVLLGSGALPTFTLVLGLTFAFGIAIWRLIWTFLPAARP